jgi:hypothetical protein
MGIKISDMTSDASIGGSEKIPVSDAGSPKSITTGALKDYVLEQIAAVSAAGTVSGSDGVFILQGGALKPVDIDVVAQHVIDAVWGKADEATVDGADVMPIKDAGVTEKTCTLSTLASYVRGAIEAAILDVSDLDSASGLSGSDMLPLTQGTTAKKVLVSDLSTAIYAALNAYVVGLTAVGTPADADVFYVIQGGVEKKVTLSALKAVTGSTIAPATTTENNVPQWASGQKTLKDGLAVKTTIRADGVADDSSIATEKAVRTLFLGALGNKLPVIDATSSTVLTASQTGSLVLLNSSDVVTLPEASGNSGVVFYFVAQTISGTAPRVDPYGTEVINSQGAQGGAGKYMYPGDANGGSIALVCDGTQWWTLASGWLTWSLEA